MEFRISRHAEWEMTRRGIPLALVQAAMDHPELWTHPRGPLDPPVAVAVQKMGRYIRCGSS